MNTRLDPSVTKPSQPGDTKPGLNKIVIKTVHYGLQGMIMEKDVAVKMRDAVTLYVNVFRPDKAGKFSVVISADTYGKDELPGKTYDRIPNTGVIGASVFAPFESPDPGFWVPNDYAVVKVALRGSANSEGVLYPLSAIEAQDYYEVIEWAAVQDWSSGSVGTNGVSYLASTQWFVASLNPPHLKAMIPWEGLNDMYREKAFHGGIPETDFFRSWFRRQVARWPGKEIEDLIEKQREHPLFDEFWKGRQAKLGQIKVPMLVGTSWSTQGLHNRGTLEGFKESSSAHKWLEVHGRKEWEYYYGREILERQKRFFDYFLKGIENDWLETPKVRLEVRERFFDGMFRFEEEWPLARTVYTKLYLDTGSMTLGHSLPQAEARTSYRTEAGASGSHSLMFKISFNQDTELTGYMKLKLWVSAEGSDDMDLFVGIKKFDKRGEEVYLADYNHIENGQAAAGWLRVSHRELDPQKATPYQPWLKHERLIKLKDGEIVPAEIEIWPSSTLFRAGESLGLVVQGSDIITAGYRCYHVETVNKGKHIILSGGKYDSHLLVPVIPPKC